MAPSLAWNEPASHAAQAAAAPAAAKVPLGHATQLVEPLWAWNLPALQLKHMDALLSPW